VSHAAPQVESFELASDAIVDGGRPAARRWPLSLRIGMALLLVIVGSGLLARIFQLGDPYAQDLGAALQGPSFHHLLGTDNLGRDVLTRTLYATTTDVQVGLTATYLALLIGVAMGVIAAFFGGWVDAVIMRLTDFVLAFPVMVLVIAIVVVFNGGLAGVYVGFIIKGWPAYARLTRAEMLVLRDQQFMLAARTLGFTNRRIIGRHALPHVLRPNLVFSFSDMLSNIVFLASLSYLGLGVQPPSPEWGNIIADGQPYILSAWWIATLPGLFVVVFGLGLSLTGEGLAERLRIRVGGVG
jgi:peptide/nickel transport system permease protein